MGYLTTGINPFPFFRVITVKYIAHRGEASSIKLGSFSEHWRLFSLLLVCGILDRRRSLIPNPQNIFWCYHSTYIFPLFAECVFWDTTLIKIVIWTILLKSVKIPATSIKFCRGKRCYCERLVISSVSIAVFVYLMMSLMENSTLLLGYGPLHLSKCCQSSPPNSVYYINGDGLEGFNVLLRLRMAKITIQVDCGKPWPLGEFR